MIYTSHKTLRNQIKDDEMRAVRDTYERIS